MIPHTTASPALPIFTLVPYFSHFSYFSQKLLFGKGNMARCRYSLEMNNDNAVWSHFIVQYCSAGAADQPSDTFRNLITARYSLMKRTIDRRKNVSLKGNRNAIP